jgi:hypothetical protein
LCDFGESSIEWVGYRTWGGPPCGEAASFVGRAPIRSGNAGAGWSISTSTTNPFENVGPLLDGHLYLWLVCAFDTGVESAEFDLAGSAIVASFEPFPPFSNSGTATELRLTAVGCPGEAYGGAILAGRIVLEPATVSVESSTWGRAKGLYRETTLR